MNDSAIIYDEAIYAEEQNFNEKMQPVKLTISMLSVFFVKCHYIIDGC